MSKIQNTKDRDSLIHMFGRQLAEHMPNFYGKIIFNMQNGNYVNCNLEQSLKPEKQEKKNEY